MPKYYAVKKGKQPGIFETWEECQEQVNKYHGAVFKSFTSLQAAEDYLAGKKTGLHKKNEKPYAYVDGSYDATNAVYGSGAIIVVDNKKYKFCFAGNNKRVASFRNVAGELEAVKYVMKFCLDNKISEITIYYDYTGIAEWATGRWKTNNPYTQHYAEVSKKVMELMKINFEKVKAHSGIPLNEEVDKLAQKGILDFLNGLAKK